MRPPVVIDVTGGTPEHGWSAVLRSLPLSRDLPRCGRVVVVAPHPDDEVLGCGGLLMTLQRGTAVGHGTVVAGAVRAPGIRLDVICVTDGEASHPGSGRVTPAGLASRRRREAATADSRLGVATRRRWLSVPDGAVPDHEGRLADELTVLLADPVTALCVAPWMGDGHPDHEATGRAASEAAGRTGTPLLAYPVWAWHWAAPAGGDLPLGGAQLLTLDADQVHRKAAAVGAHRSQVRPLGPDPADGPVLTDGVLAHFRRPFEVFLR